MNDETNDQAEVEEVVDTIRPAFDEAIAGDQGEDDVKMAMITAGASFKNVTRLYNKYMVDAGFAVSKEEKDEIVGKSVEGKDLSTEDGFSKASAAIQKKATGVTEKSAAALIRAWAKAQDGDIEVYKKAASAGGPRVSVRSRFFDALIANPAMTEAACKEHLANDKETSENVMKHESVYQGIRELVNRIASGPAPEGVAKAA